MPERSSHDGSSAAIVDRYRDSTWLGSGTLAERIANHLQLIDLLCAQGKSDEAAALDERFMERLRWEMA